MKQYFENIEWWDYLIFLVYNGIFCYLLHRIGDVFFAFGKKTIWTFFFIFQLYFCIVVADSLFDFIPFLPDTDLYSFMLSSGEYPDTSSENLIIFYYVTLFIGLICLNSPVIYVFFCVFLYILALMLFLRAWKKIHSDFSTTDEFTFSLLCVVWPAAALYITVPLREAFILMGFALFFNGFVNFLYKKQWKSLVFGSIIMCAIRLQFIVFVFPVIGALMVYRLRIKPILKATILITTIFIAFLAVRYVLVEKPLSPQTMAELRNVNLLHAGPLGYGNVEWDSYADMAVDYPFIIAQFLFSPLPIFVDHNPISTLIPFLDLVFLMILLLIIILKFRYHLKHHTAIILLMILYIILFGAYEYHITGAVRHRMPLTILFMLMSTITISKWLFKKKIHEETEHSVINNK